MDGKSLLSEEQRVKILLTKTLLFFLLLWQLARFHCGSWRVFIVAVGAFSLWQLARFCCGSWLVFVVAVGTFSLWQLARFRCGSWHNKLSFVQCWLCKNRAQSHGSTDTKKQNVVSVPCCSLQAGVMF